MAELRRLERVDGHLLHLDDARHRLRRPGGGQGERRRLGSVLDVRGRPGRPRDVLGGHGGDLPRDDGVERGPGRCDRLGLVPRVGPPQVPLRVGDQVQLGHERRVVRRDGDVGGVALAHDGGVVGLAVGGGAQGERAGRRRRRGAGKERRGGGDGCDGEGGGWLAAPTGLAHVQGELRDADLGVGSCFFGRVWSEDRGRGEREVTGDGETKQARPPMTTKAKQI